MISSEKGREKMQREEARTMGISEKGKLE